MNFRISVLVWCASTIAGSGWAQTATDDRAHTDISAIKTLYPSAAYEEAVIHLEAALQLIEEEGTLTERRTEVLERLGDFGGNFRRERDCSGSS